MRKKIVRITTVPESLKILLKGQLNYISQYYTVIGISSDSEELCEVSKLEGISVFPVNMTRKITPIKDLISLIKLIFILAKLKPHIVHTHTPKAGLLGMLASWLIRVPNRMHTVAGLPLMEAKGSKKKLLILIEKITYFCATRVYPNSFGLNEYILKNIYKNSDKLKVIANGSSNGIDLDFFKRDVITNQTILELQKKFDINENTFVFIFIGRIVSDKGINELVKAFSCMSIDSRNIKLLLVGKIESDLDPLNSDTILEIESNLNIFHVDFVNDVRPYLAVSSCLVFPSYREGFPNVVMQAASMELPCIVSNINGCNEIIIEGINGLIVEVKNVASLVRAMGKLLNDTGLYNKLKINARKTIAMKYDRKLVWSEILKEYKNLE